MAAERRPCTVLEAKAGLRALRALDGEWTSLAYFPGEPHANATVLRERRCARRAEPCEPPVRGLHRIIGAVLQLQQALCAANHPRTKRMKRKWQRTRVLQSGRLR